MDKLKDKLKTAAIVLAAVDGDKVQLAAGVTADSIGKVKAGELVNFVAQQVGGKGGGKPDMAMAGGTDAKALPAALASVQAWVGERVRLPLEQTPGHGRRSNRPPRSFDEQPLQGPGRALVAFKPLEQP